MSFSGRLLSFAITSDKLSDLIIQLLSFQKILYQRKDQCHKQASDHDQNTLSYLLFPVVTKVLPSCAAFRLREIVLKKMCLRQQKEIQTDDIKSLYDSPDDKKPHEKLLKSKSMLSAIHTADDEQTDVANNEQDQNDPPENTFGRHRQTVDPRFQSFLHVCQKVLRQ